MTSRPQQEMRALLSPHATWPGARLWAEAVRMRTQVREADMRSLDRRRMYEIFAPLDPDERLPRELLMEERRFRSVGRREVAGFMWLPALLASLTILGWMGGGGLIAIGVAAVLLASLWLFAESGKRPSG